MNLDALMLRAIAAAKWKNDKIDAGKIADCLLCDFLPECCRTSTTKCEHVRLGRARSRERAGFSADHFLTSAANPFVNVHDMKVCFMSSRLSTQSATHFTHAIARMLGKAVKFRHCPATVSAPASLFVVYTESSRTQPGHLDQGIACKTTGARPRGLALGRWLERRKSGDRS